LKTLVVYYTRTGNTKFIAERVARGLGAETEEVIDERNRRGPIGFLRSGYESTRGLTTKIRETREDPRSYDLVVVGTPVWNGRPSSPIRTWLSKQDLAGKKTAIFCANSSRSGDEAAARTRALIPDCDYRAHLVVTNAVKNGAASEARISEWCGELKSL